MVGVQSIKNFVVHEELGSGAFGRVALATWTTKGRVVALKKVEQAHLLQEGEIQMSLRSVICVFPPEMKCKLNHSDSLNMLSVERGRVG